MSRNEIEVRRDLMDALEILARLDERRERLQGHVDTLNRELCELSGAASDRPVAVR